ncbi:MAG: HAD family hydrolase [Promethearchaeota archaeon]
MVTSSALIEAVFFDVDGVVVESELLHLQTFNEILEPYGIEVSEKEWKTRFLGAGSATIMTTLFEEHGIIDDPTPIIDQRRILYREHVLRGDLQPIPGFIAFYESVINAHLPVAFVSTGHPANLNAALESLGLLGKHPVIDVTQVTRIKPDPEPYLIAAHAVRVPPKKCLVFEDSPIGIMAAKSAGMTCVALTTTNPPEDLAHADLVISNFLGMTIHSLIGKLGKRVTS